MAYAIGGVLANTIGRRISIIMCFMIGGVSCLLYEPASSWGVEWAYVFLLFGKFGASCTFGMVYLVTI